MTTVADLALEEMALENVYLRERLASREEALAVMSDLLSAALRGHVDIERHRNRLQGELSQERDAHAALRERLLLEGATL